MVGCGRLEWGGVGFWLWFGWVFVGMGKGSVVWVGVQFCNVPAS